MQASHVEPILFEHDCLKANIPLCSIKMGAREPKENSIKEI